MKALTVFLIAVVVLSFNSSVFGQGSAKVVKVSAGQSVYKIKRGASVQVAVIVDVDNGYHVNSNRPLEENLIPTALKINRITGFSTTPVTYPRAKLQKFEFSKRPMSVFEGKAVLKFSVRALSTLTAGSHTLSGKLTVQACNNQQCLRPQTIDVSIPLQVE